MQATLIVSGLLTSYIGQFLLLSNFMNFAALLFAIFSTPAASQGEPLRVRAPWLSISISLSICVPVVLTTIDRPSAANSALFWYWLSCWAFLVVGLETLLRLKSYSWRQRGLIYFLIILLYAPLIYGFINVADATVERSRVYTNALIVEKSPDTDSDSNDLLIKVQFPEGTGSHWLGVSAAQYSSLTVGQQLKLPIILGLFGLTRYPNRL